MKAIIRVMVALALGSTLSTTAIAEESAEES